ncbi:MAG: hypothetical protein R3C97_02880 [Geminicoccaceae bacterium]
MVRGAFPARLHAKRRDQDAGLRRIAGPEGGLGDPHHIETRPDDGALDEFNDRLHEIRDDLAAKAEAVDAGSAKIEDFSAEIAAYVEEMSGIAENVVTASGAPVADSAVSRAIHALDGSPESAPRRRNAHHRPFRSAMKRRALLAAPGLGLLVAVMAMVAAPVGGARAQSAGASFDDIVERGWMVFGVYEDFAPYSWVEGDAFFGIDVDLARRSLPRLASRHGSSPWVPTRMSMTICATMSGKGHSSADPSPM